LPVPFERVDAGHHEARRERAVGVTASGEHIAVPIDPNATAAQMAQAVATALGAPWEAEGNVVRQREQVAPAPGQVWLPPPSVGWAESDGTLTLDAIAPGEDGGLSRIRWTNGATCAASMVTAPGGGWTCIGVATPHGRVMVGDGFRQVEGSQVERRIMAVVEGTQVRCGFADGDEPVDVPASIFVAAMGRDKGYHRTRYAPARAGERYRCRQSGSIYKGEGASIGLVWSAETTERLAPGQGAERSTLGRELAFDYGGSIKGPPSVDYPYTLPDLANQARTLTLAPGSRLTPLGDGRTYRIEPEPERPSITLQAPAPQLRALFDAIGRALELPATRHVCAFGEGLTVTVLRDEMLFTPTAQTGLGTAELAGDARALCALRAAVATAMANGAATIAQWGAKGPRVEVRREGGAAMRATTASEPSEAPRYTPDPDGAGAWRWTPSNHY
jgi:hypothetical protein